MMRFLFASILIAIAHCSIAETLDDNFHYITSEIVKYTQAFERCKELARNRPRPDESLIQRLRNFSRTNVERFLISKSMLARHECEKPEITDLAHAILITENEKLQQQTKAAISAIKVLAFSADYRKFQRIYHSTPEKMRQDLESLNDFSRPFDEKLLLDLVY